MTPQELAQQRIDECRSTCSPELNLSGLGLEEIPEQVFELTWLESLDISGNVEHEKQIAEIPKEISRLKDLKEFVFQNTWICDLSPVSDLLQLKVLDFNNNYAINDLDPLSGLLNLEYLNCSGCIEIDNIHALLELKKLHQLECSSTSISNLDPLTRLTQLQILNISNSRDIDELSQLSSLLNLQELNFSHTLVYDITCLEKLSKLKHLNCSYTAIRNTETLSKFLQLEVLDCGYVEIEELGFLSKLLQLITLDVSNYFPLITDIEPLSNLLNIQTLRFSSNSVSSLQSLSKLINLQDLDFSSNQIEDLSHLSILSKLQWLNCSSNKIEDLKPLSGLSKLTVLDCSANNISHLTSIAELTHLKHIFCGENQIKDLSPLSNLLNLRWINCSKNQVMDLSPLSDLSQLEYFSCDSNKVNSLEPLSCLKNLQSVRCSYNEINSIMPLYALIMSYQLTSLRLYGNPISGIPGALLGKENVFGGELWDIQNYWEDLKKGAEKKQQLKVQLVGNGRVGKTTLAYALEHNRAPSEPLKSTHGIVIKEIQQLLDSEDEPITLQLWDFGGQEIYHATHRLFLSDDCLYLLLWAEDSEEQDQDETIHPVSYWLELIHDLGRNSPVIVVKNQIDRSDQLPPRPAELTNDMPGVNQIRQEVKISACKYKNINALRGAIQDVLTDLKHRVCLELPISWMQVQREVEQLHDQKIIPFTDFKKLCIKAGVSHPEWFVGYLHKTGVLFYQKGAFEDQIILDQNWAIEAVYRVFDPQKPHRRRIQRMNGCFNGEDASLFWADKDMREHEIYLNFMHNCGICYEANQKDNKPFAEREFIIPALLPKNSDTQAAWGEPNSDDWLLEVEYPFLHRSIIERVILRLGETYQGKPWRTGIFCETEDGRILLYCKFEELKKSNKGKLCFHLRGERLDHLLINLSKLVSQISPDRRYQAYLTQDGKTKPLKLFQEQDKPTMISKPIKIFISYSHVDEAYKDELEICLKNIERRFPMKIEYWNDRQLLAGESVDGQILPMLDRADIVILLISRNFFASDYCFTTELPKALKRYKENDNIIIPIIIRETADWHDFEIGKIVVLPTDGKPLTDWPTEDKFWADVQKGIRQQVERRLTKGIKIG